jgi:hypothetical protein
MWCHRIPHIEDGCLLLANQPGMGFYEVGFSLGVLRLCALLFLCYPGFLGFSENVHLQGGRLLTTCNSHHDAHSVALHV